MRLGIVEKQVAVLGICGSERMISQFDFTDKGEWINFSKVCNAPMFLRIMFKHWREQETLRTCSGKELLEEGILEIGNELGLNFKLIVVIDEEWVRFSEGVGELERQDE